MRENPKIGIWLFSFEVLAHLYERKEIERVGQQREGALIRSALRNTPSAPDPLRIRGPGLIASNMYNAADVPKPKRQLPNKKP